MPEQPTPDAVYTEAAEAACAQFREGSRASADAEGYAASRWFRAAVDAAYERGLREATEGWPDRAALLRLVRELVDEDGCSFDHHGGCQAHGYLSLKPGEQCPHAEAKALLVGPWEPADQPGGIA